MKPLALPDTGFFLKGCCQQFVQFVYSPGPVAKRREQLKGLQFTQQRKRPSVNMFRLRDMFELFNVQGVSFQNKIRQYPVLRSTQADKKKVV